jgi:hypothetical protein
MIKDNSMKTTNTQPAALPESAYQGATPELQDNAMLIRALRASLQATCELEGDPPISSEAFKLFVAVMRFENRLRSTP